MHKESLSKERTTKTGTKASKLSKGLAVAALAGYFLGLGAMGKSIIDSRDASTHYEASIDLTDKIMEMPTDDPKYLEESDKLLKEASEQGAAGDANLASSNIAFDIGASTIAIASMPGLGMFVSLRRDEQI